MRNLVKTIFFRRKKKTNKRKSPGKKNSSECFFFISLNNKIGDITHEKISGKRKFSRKILIDSPHKKTHFLYEKYFLKFLKKSTRIRFFPTWLQIIFSWEQKSPEIIIIFFMRLLTQEENIIILLFIMRENILFLGTKFYIYNFIIPEFLFYLFLFMYLFFATWLHNFIFLSWKKKKKKFHMKKKKNLKKNQV